MPLDKIIVGSETGQTAANKINTAFDAVDVNTQKKTYPDNDRTKLAGIEAGAQQNVKPDWNAAVGTDAEILNKPNTVDKAYVDAGLSSKVDIEQGKTLSTNDFTDADKTKLDSLHNTVIEDSLTSVSTTDALSAKQGSVLNNLVQANKTKLDGIEDQAQKNVQSDWTSTDTNSDAFILNKPSVVDNLNSTSTTDVLSANQGKILNDKISANTSDITNLKKIGQYKGLYADTTARDAAITTPVDGDYVLIGGGSPYLEQIYDAGTTSWQDAGTVNSPVSIAVEDSLTSTSTTDALSANQGKILNETKEDKLPTPTKDDQILLGKTDGTKVWVDKPIPAGDSILLDNYQTYSTNDMATPIEPTDNVNTGIGKLERFDKDLMIDMGNIHAFVAGSTLADKLMDLKKQVDQASNATSTTPQDPVFAATVPCYSEPDGAGGVFVYIDIEHAIDNPNITPAEDITDGQEHFVKIMQKSGVDPVPDATTWAWTKESTPARWWTNTQKTKAASASTLLAWINSGAFVKVKKDTDGWYVTDVVIPATPPTTAKAILSDGSVQMDASYLPSKDGDVVTHSYMVGMTEIFATKDLLFSAVPNTFSGDAEPTNSLGKNGDYYEKFPTKQINTFFDQNSSEIYDPFVFYIYKNTSTNSGLTDVSILPQDRIVNAWFVDEAPKYTGMKLYVNGTEIPLTLQGTTQHSHVFKYGASFDTLIKTITTSTPVKGTAEVLTGEYKLYKKIDGVWKENKPYSRPTIVQPISGAVPTKAECVTAFKQIFNYNWETAETFYIHDNTNHKGFQVHYNPNGATDETGNYEFWFTEYTQAQ